MEEKVFTIKTILRKLLESEEKPTLGDVKQAVVDKNLNGIDSNKINIKGGNKIIGQDDIINISSNKPKETDSTEELQAVEYLKNDYFKNKPEAISSVKCDETGAPEIYYKKSEKHNIASNLGIKSAGGLNKLDIDIFIPYTDEFSSKKKNKIGLGIAIDGIDHNDTFTKNVYANDLIRTSKEVSGKYDILRINVLKKDVEGELEKIKEVIKYFCDTIFNINSTHESRKNIKDDPKKEMLQRLISYLENRKRKNNDDADEYIRDRIKISDNKNKYFKYPEELPILTKSNARLSEFLKTKAGKRSFWEHDKEWSEIAGRDVKRQDIENWKLKHQAKGHESLSNIKLFEEIKKTSK